MGCDKSTLPGRNADVGLQRRETRKGSGQNLRHWNKTKREASEWKKHVFTLKKRTVESGLRKAPNVTHLCPAGATTIPYPRALIIRKKEV